jgi:hypothetical protein
VSSGKIPRAPACRRSLLLLSALLSTLLATVPEGSRGRAAAQSPTPAGGASGLATPHPARTPAEGEAARIAISRAGAIHDPMPWASLAFRLGMAQVHAGTVKNPAYNAVVAERVAQLGKENVEKTGIMLDGSSCTLIDRTCRTAGRFGAHVVAAVHLGGDGFGWDLEPYATFGSASQAYGLYTGAKLDVQIAPPAYVGVGLGFRAAYVKAEGWRYGADLGARIPLQATLYVLPQLALSMDVGFGVGATGYVSRTDTIVDPVSQKPLGKAPRMTFGAARTWDLSVGVRFP